MSICRVRPGRLVPAIAVQFNGAKVDLALLNKEFMMARILTATAEDGTQIRAVDQGGGRPVLIVHGGLDDGSSWHKVAQLLAPRWRVIRLHRRQYRLDLAATLPCSTRQEAGDVLALAAALGEPAILVGHSSGAVVALEALVAAPSSFAAAVLYEPPVHLRPREWDAALGPATAAVAAGRPGRAIRVFIGDIVKLPSITAWLAGATVAMVPRFRRLAPHQIDDAVAINDLGVRLDAYARVDRPAVLLGGDRSPAHLGARLDALARVMTTATKVVLPGVGHDANWKAPAAVARVIESVAGE
jgi:pimeloyl-ACP methyl ester carboxylesterase